MFNEIAQVSLIYMGIGVIITLLYWKYLDIYYPTPDKFIMESTQVEKSLITFFLLIIMSLVWIVLYPTLVAVTIKNKRIANE